MLFNGAKILSILVFVMLTARFPKPDPAAAFSELKIQAGGSPLRQPREDWAGARKRVAQDAKWKRWLQRTREETDHWIATRHDRVEWVAGWWHDFVDPEDGNFLVWTPDEPGENTLTSRSGRTIRLTEKLHRAWVYSFRSRHSGTMAEAAMLFRLTGEEKYARWAAAQLDFYATNYSRWPLQTEKGKARLMHQSLDEAVNLIRLVNTARFLDGYAKADRKALWARQLFKPEAQLLQESFTRIHNIACWQRSAIGHVALYSGDRSLWQEAVGGPFGIRSQLEEGVTSDYLWFEQSLGYNAYVVRGLYPFLLYAAQQGRGAELQWEMSVVQNLMLSPIALRFPTGQLPNPADTTGGPGRAPNLELLAGCYRLFPTPWGLEQATRNTNWDTLVDPPPGASPAALPETISRSLESSRMAILRKGPWQVYFHYGQLDRSHAQAEALNFEAFHGETDVTHDPGTVGYGSPLHRGYFTTGLAHNVPLIDGQGQESWNPGRLDKYDPENGLVAASQDQYRQGVRVRRELSVQGISLVDRVRVEAATAGKVGLVLHLQGEVELPAAFRAQADFARGRAESFAHWSDVKSASFERSASLLVRYPGKTMRVSFSLPGTLTVSHGRSPDTPPRKRDSLYVETSGQSVTFQTVIEPEETATAH